jgi:S1-C subfamily serine protease
MLGLAQKLRTPGVPPSNTSGMKRLLAGIVALGALGAACTTAHGTVPTPPFSAVRQATQEPLPPIPQARDPVVAVVQRVRPAVVNVTTNLLEQGPFGGAQPGRGVGTGFIIRSDGVVVTNWHVVEGATRIKVITPPPNQQEYQARVIGGDASADLAVLEISATGLPTVPLGHSSTLKLGQRVVALGYALALSGGPTVTSGIVSALNRTITAQDPNFQQGQRSYTHVIQTDAAINPGNSGGPLVDLAGRVIGINTAGAGQAENIGFAISIDEAVSVIRDAVANPQGPVAFLGVSTTDVTPGLAFQFGLPVRAGAYVVSVAPGGPAVQAGVGNGDVIVSFEGQSVSGSDQLGNLIHDHKPGDTVSVGVVESSGQRRTFTVTLGVNPLP